MSNKNDDFSFDDDFLSDDSDPFSGFDDDEGFVPDLGDDFIDDMPVIEEQAEERGTNRTFLYAIGALILLFFVGLAVVLVLALGGGGDRGPSDAELTVTFVVQFNATIDAFAAETSTQDVQNVQLTQTALAASPTPSPTQTPSPTESPTPRPTITPTPTIDPTDLALRQIAEQALAATADAANATPTDEPPTPETGVIIPANLRSAFATEVAYSTAQAIYLQALQGTVSGLATQGASAAQIDAVVVILSGTQTALDASLAEVQAAQGVVNDAFRLAARVNEELATQLAVGTVEAQGTQSALNALLQAGTPGAQATQNALSTLSVDLQNLFGTPGAPGSNKIRGAGESAIADRVAQATLIAQGPLTATVAAEQTRGFAATQTALAPFGNFATQAAAATQSAFGTQAAGATQVALATQDALATRAAIIGSLLGETATFAPPTETPLVPATIDPLQSINQTATALVAPFLTATAEAGGLGAITVTPGLTQVPAVFATPSELPDTGLFDDISGGGGVGALALAIVGLVGVIALARFLRSSNSDDRKRK